MTSIVKLTGDRRVDYRNVARQCMDESAAAMLDVIGQAAEIAQARVAELEAENERLQPDAKLGSELRELLGDALTRKIDPSYSCNDLMADAALGRDLRCLLECGLWVRMGVFSDGLRVRIRFPAGHPQLNSRGWALYDTTPEAASAVREWQAGQWKPETAPSPEDTARARIAAAGATIHEGRALRVEAENGVWSTRSVVEDEAWVLEELAAFAEANRAPQGALPPDELSRAQQDVEQQLLAELCRDETQSVLDLWLIAATNRRSAQFYVRVGVVDRIELWVWTWSALQPLSRRFVFTDSDSPVVHLLSQLTSLPMGDAADRLDWSPSEPRLKKSS